MGPGRFNAAQAFPVRPHLYFMVDNMQDDKPISMLRCQPEQKPAGEQEKPAAQASYNNSNTGTGINKLFSNIDERITELQRENFELKQRIDQLEDRLKTVERYQQNGWDV